jgi:hypothetical protein
MTTLHLRSAIAAGSLVLAALLVAGCAGAGPSPSQVQSPASTPAGSASAPTAVPGSSDTAPATSPGPDDPAAGGGSAGDPGTGTGGDPGVVDPARPEPTIVTPAAGLTGVHPVGAAALDTALNGRDVAVRVAWWSGVEPCSVLAGVDVARDGHTFTLTVREGSAAAPDTACIEIAQYKATIVDLGELEPGTYTIAAFGDAAPVTITVD